MTLEVSRPQSPRYQFSLPSRARTRRRAEFQRARSADRPAPSGCATWAARHHFFFANSCSQIPVRGDDGARAVRANARSCVRVTHVRCPYARVNPARAVSSRASAKLFLGGDVADSTQRDPRAARPAGAAGGAARPPAPLRFSLNDGARAFGRTLMMMGVAAGRALRATGYRQTGGIERSAVITARVHAGLAATFRYLLRALVHRRADRCQGGTGSGTGHHHQRNQPRRQRYPQMTLLSHRPNPLWEVTPFRSASASRRTG